jgi:hypothetical protein
MRKFHYKPPSQLGIDRPWRLACGAKMWLSLIEPGDHPNFDARTFECLGYGHTETIVVEIKSAAATFAR